MYVYTLLLPTVQFRSFNFLFANCVTGGIFVMPKSPRAMKPWHRLIGQDSGIGNNVLLFHKQLTMQNHIKVLL